MGTPPHAELSLMHLEEGEWEEMKPCGVTKDRKKWWWPGKEPRVFPEELPLETVCLLMDEIVCLPDKLGLLHTPSSRSKFQV